ncbi:MAG: adenosylmethionine decarboxylase [Anaerolineae bacterium]
MNTHHSSTPAGSAERIPQGYLVRHVIIELTQCPFAVLDDVEHAERVLEAVADAIRTEVMARVRHHFTPQGVTAVLVVGASHLSIHTWPEHGYASVDLVVCTDNFDLQEVVDLVKDMLEAGHASFLEFRRGLVG